jgi:hypothetical protein
VETVESSNQNAREGLPMIDFQCRCSKAFSFADDRAGESFQCPSCGLLVDVPTLEELQAMQADGSYTLTDADLPADDLTAVRNTPSVANKHDHRDRRMSLKDFLAIGTTDDDLLEIKDEIKAGVPKHPKYDPVTGELIVPMEIKRAVQAAPLMAEAAVLGYEVKKRDGTPSFWLPFTEMFRLPNLIVCAIVSFMWMLVCFLSGIHAVFTLLVFPVFLMLISHLANVIDETGPTGNDEIPRPLRGANLYEDMIRPLGQVMFAYALASAPILLFNLYVRHLPLLANLGLGVLFYILIPALLLTLITSGALNNLVPSRALSVIGASSWHYWVVALLGYVSTASFLFATAIATDAGYSFLAIISKGQAAILGGNLFGVPQRLELFIAPIAVFGAMYLLHVFTWQMGMMYRLHHEQFAWVLQKADKTERNDMLAQLHRHRQRENEARARKARENMEQRFAGLKQ